MSATAPSGPGVSVVPVVGVDHSHPAFAVATDRLAQHLKRTDATITSILFWKPQRVIEHPSTWDEHQANRGEVSITVKYVLPASAYAAPLGSASAVFNIDLAALTVPIWRVLNEHAPTS